MGKRLKLFLLFITTLLTAASARPALVREALPKELTQKIGANLQAQYNKESVKEGVPPSAYGEAVDVKKSYACHFNFKTQSKQFFVLDAPELKTKIRFDGTNYDILITLDDKKNLDIKIMPQQTVEDYILTDAIPQGKLRAKVRVRPHSVYSNLQLLYLDIEGIRPATRDFAEERIKRSYPIGMIYTDVSELINNRNMSRIFKNPQV